MTSNHDRFGDGYSRAVHVESIPPENRDGMSPREWFSHPQNRPLHTDRRDFIDGYNKRVQAIAEAEGWVPSGLEPESF